jgi:hypothetical protein
MRRFAHDALNEILGFKVAVNDVVRVQVLCTLLFSHIVPRQLSRPP